MLKNNSKVSDLDDIRKTSSYSLRNVKQMRASLIKYS